MCVPCFVRNTCVSILYNFMIMSTCFSSSSHSYVAFCFWVYRLFVKDAPQLIECIHSISTEGRDILLRILTDVDSSCGNGRFRCAARIALCGHGDIRRKTDGVVDAIFLLLRHVVIVAVFAVGYTDTICTVVRLVFEVAKGERPCGEFVLVGSRLTCDESTPEVGILSGVDVKAAATAKNPA